MLYGLYMTGTVNYNVQFSINTSIFFFQISFCVDKLCCANFKKSGTQ